ncbi:MAG: eCIS core domain-containing protein [Halobacteriota archaeon]
MKSVSAVENRGRESVPKATFQEKSAKLPSLVHQVFRSPGQPLDTATRAFMEPRFGHTFGNVRVHTDSRADESVRAMNARAYTVGRDVVFKVEYYKPETWEGRRLLAHELAHVIQSDKSGSGHELTMDVGPSDYIEQNAERIAQQVAAGGHIAPAQLVVPSALPLLQRYRVPSDLACEVLVGWLNNNSPYAPEWAQTNCDYSFNGQIKLAKTELPNGGRSYNVKGHDKLTVSVKCPIDRPEWIPSKRENQAAEISAWNSMRAELDKHEREHQTIGKTWRGILENYYRRVDFNVTGVDDGDAMSKAQNEVDARRRQWMAEAQAAQDAIDPFRAKLVCPSKPNAGAR